MATVQTPSGLSVDSITGKQVPSLSTGQTPGSDPGLDAYLNANLTPYTNTIMQNYDAAKKATSTAGDSVNKSLTDTGNFNISYGQEQGKNQLTGAQESQRGFVANPGALNYLQDSSTKRIRDLTTQMNDALANNRTDVAAKLSDLALRENEAITNARTSFLTQYFQGKAEQRAESEFQTPEQKQVLALAAQYPNAGIVPGDTLDAAQKKVSGSAQYKLQQSGVQAGITASLASAGLANAQAALAGIQTKGAQLALQMMGGNPGQYSQDVTDLKSGKMTIAQLHDKYDSLKSPDGTSIGPYIVSGIISQFQAGGGNIQASTLKSSAQTSQNEALNSGNPFLMTGAFGTQAIGALGTALTGNGSAFSSFSAPSTLTSNPLKGTDGTVYGFPGYVSDGTKWVKK